MRQRRRDGGQKGAAARKGAAKASSAGAGATVRHRNRWRGDTLLMAEQSAAAGTTATNGSAISSSSASIGRSSRSTLPHSAIEIWRKEQAALAASDMAGGGAVGLLQTVAANSTPQQQPRKRGRPKGSVDTKPRKKPVPPEVKWSSEADKTKCLAAKHAMGLMFKGVERAKADIIKCKEELVKAQAKLEAAEKRVGRAEDAVQAMSNRKADDLLLEPTDWNKQYTKLISNFSDDKGKVISVMTSKLKDIPDENKRKMYRSLIKWQSRQRTARKEGKLEPYQEILLDRVGFCWNPPQGPIQGPEGKWFKHYRNLKEFKNLHGHFNVPKGYPPDPRLREWLKTQISTHHAKLEGRPDAKYLTDEREQLLEKLGVEWGSKRITMPWETRFLELMQYRKEHGHW